MGPFVIIVLTYLGLLLLATMFADVSTFALATIVAGVVFLGILLSAYLGVGWWERREEPEEDDGDAPRVPPARAPSAKHPLAFDLVMEAGEESFPCSDPPCWTPGAAGSPHVEHHAG